MNTKRLTNSAALGLALAALATPAFGASQDLRNVDQVTPNVEAPQELRSPDTIDAAAGRGTDRSPDVVEELRSPDTIDAAAGRGTDRSPDVVEVRQELRSPDTIDAAAGRGMDRSPDVVVVRLPAETAAVAPAEGLNWQDAGIGAGGLLALALIGLGGTLLVVHHRRGVAPTAGAR